MIKININRTGFIDPQFNGVCAHSHTLASLADVFEKNEKKNKTMSVYRLEQGPRKEGGDKGH